MVMIGLTVNLGGFIVAYNLWAKFYGLAFPIPFLGIIREYIETIMFLTIIWFSLPKNWRKDKQINRGMKWYIVLILVHYFMNNLNQITVPTIKSVEERYQPVACIALPAFKEFFIWILSKILKKCAHQDVSSAKTFLRYAISAKYAITICNYLGTFATEITSWVLMGIDFSFNIGLCLHLVYLRKRKPDKMDKQIEVIEELALYETVEFHAPLAYALILGVTYHGPNGHLYGNILNSSWTFNAIKDIYQTLKSMLLFFMVDFCSTITSAVILWFSCKIKLWKVFAKIQKEFGVAFALILSHQLIIVSIIDQDFRNSF